MKQEIIAIPSGDHEGFCFDVSREDFMRIKNAEPDKYDKSWFNKGYYRIYPQDLFRVLYGSSERDGSKKIYKFNISLESEEVDKTSPIEDYNEYDKDLFKWRDED